MCWQSDFDALVWQNNMKLLIEPATLSKSRAGRFTTDQILSMLDSDNENELLNGVDYASDEIA